jgi:hypothetical protein
VISCCSVIIARRRNPDRCFHDHSQYIYAPGKSTFQFDTFVKNLKIRFPVIPANPGSDPGPAPKSRGVSLLIISVYFPEDRQPPQKAFHFNRVSLKARKNNCILAGKGMLSRMFLACPPSLWGKWLKSFPKTKLKKIY